MTELENRWESLRSEPLFELRRAGRFLVAELKGGHNVISTSVRHGGMDGAPAAGWSTIKAARARLIWTGIA